MNDQDTDLLFRLIGRLEASIRAMPAGARFDNDVFRIGCAILRVVYRNLDARGRVDLEFTRAVDKNIEICRKEFFGKVLGGEGEDFAIANQLPLFIVNLLIARGARGLERKGFSPMIRHPKSDVRACTFHTLWILRDRMNNPAVVRGLLYNLAENLGYISEAAGLLRGIVGDDEAFFRAADSFMPPIPRTLQYVTRVDQIRDEKLLPSCLRLMTDFEAEVAAL